MSKHDCAFDYRNANLVPLLLQAGKSNYFTRAASVRDKKYLRRAGLEITGCGPGALKTDFTF
jgi:hypothetical protein